jgi:hypothetical protein
MASAPGIATAPTAPAPEPTSPDGFWPTDYKAFNLPSDFARGAQDKVRVDGGPDGVALALKNKATDGTWTSAWYRPPTDFSVLVPSWRADTPSGTWVEVELQVRTSTTKSQWFTAGPWAFDDSTIERQSLNGQIDDIGRIWTDTFVAHSTAPGGNPEAYRLRVTLHGDGATTPSVQQLAATTTRPGALPTTTSEPVLSDSIELDVPRLSQSIHSGEYPQFGGGGQVWCSPTSTAMVMDFWGVGPTEDDLATLPHDAVFDRNDSHDAQVPWAAIHAWDHTYRGAGNWPYNTAYASHYGLDGSVRHYSSLRGLERWIERGVPAVVSIRWNNNDGDPLTDLDGSHISSTNGHLMVVIGFTDDGDVIVNDPASPTNEHVRLVYRRDQFERNWLRASDGASYIIKPTSIEG